MAGIKAGPGEPRVSALSTLQQQREEDCLANAVRKRRLLEGGLPPAGIGRREFKALAPATIETLQLALSTRDGGRASVPQSPHAANELLGET